MSELPKFSELGLSEMMLETLNKKGFEEPTPIQAKTIPFLLTTDKDLIGKAQTGTGKTAAFGIPLIEKISAKSKKVQAIILAPTRELAIQVTEELASFAVSKGLRIMSIYGGQPIDRQISQLKRGVDIVVGTPGRVIDHLNRRTLDISDVAHVVLDEADEMLNMGFVEDIESILQAVPANRRVVLFSATMPAHIERLAKKYMGEYEVISVVSGKVNRDNIQQIYFEVPQSDKFEALYRIIDVEAEFYGMIFVRTKLDADDIAQKLASRGCPVEAIHGDLSQSQREKVLRKFRKKTTTILVATDVAARGIDVEDLTHVINYAIPQDPESYVHRIGRTGRAGKPGIAVTLITPSEYRKLVTIQRVANTKITKQTLPAVSDIIETKKQRVKESLKAIVEAGKFSELESIAEEILAETPDPKTALAALLKMVFEDQFNERNYTEIREGRKTRDSFNDEGNSSRSGQGRDYVDRKGTARMFIAKGRMDDMGPRELVEFIQAETGVDQRKIDDVKILESFSFFAAPFEDAERIIKAFHGKADNGRSLVSRAKEKDGGGERSGERSGGRSGGFGGERRRSGGGGNRSGGFGGGERGNRSGGERSGGRKKY
jgi:ATP-dependent RNA helicase DeaD